jgi:glycerate 2-kinase
MHTSTCGTGDLIRQALDCGVARILVGVGGSATNDGGIGMARSLGAKFLDRQGGEIPDGGGALARLCRIDVRGLDPRLKRVAVDVACDVQSPLFGPRGAAKMYARQKGATPAMIRQLDAGLRQYARVIRQDLGINVAKVPGAGAAGGTGAGLMAFLRGNLKSGVGVVIEAVQLERRLKGCGLVITGEGRIDGQTVCGKTVSGVARIAKSQGIPVIAICGCAGEGAEEVLSAGVDAYFTALEEPIDESALPTRGPGLLTRCAEQVARLLALRLDV